MNLQDYSKIVLDHDPAIGEEEEEEEEGVLCLCVCVCVCMAPRLTAHSKFYEFSPSRVVAIPWLTTEQSFLSGHALAPCFANRFLLAIPWLTAAPTVSWWP